MLVSPEVDLAALSDQEFKTVVDAYLRGEAAETVVATLRGPLVQRVIDTLQANLRSVRAQLEAREAEADETEALLRLGRVSQREADEKLASYSRWKASAVRFRDRLEDALDEHQRLLRQTRVEELERAITKHRNSHVGPARCCWADQELWAVLRDGT